MTPEGLLQMDVTAFAYGAFLRPVKNKMKRELLYIYEEEPPLQEAVHMAEDEMAVSDEACIQSL